jgi:L-ascorbate metabolism protein UlaG (beta-lactamase superfamily)
MKITYIYHSCFALEFNEFNAIIDYYEDTAKSQENGYIHSYLLRQPQKLYVLSSHSHADHFNSEVLNWKLQKSNIQYIFSKDILDAGLANKEDALYLDKLDSYKDEYFNIKAYGSTDIGISFLIQTSKKKIFHAGDLNNWHWDEECSVEEAQEYENNYLIELELLAKDLTHLNLVFFPIDPRLGKDYMKGAEQFINRIPTDILAPMHFDEAYNKAAAFASYAETKKCKSIKWANKGDNIKL